MRRSLASHYRIKTAHHLLNIVALKREMDTYSVNGLLKAASTGHSKEACLRYAGLQAALLFEKRALDEYASVLVKQGGGSPPSKPTFTRAAYDPKPAATPRAPGQIPGLTTEVPGLSRGMQGDISAGTTTGQRNAAITAANVGARQNLPRPGAGGVVGNNRPPEQQGFLDWNVNGPNNHSNMADAPTKGYLADQNAGTTTKARLAGVNMAGTNFGGGKPIGVAGGVAAGTNPKGGMPIGVPAARAAGIAAAQPSTPVPARVIPKPSYTEDPIEAAYSKKLNEGAATAAASKQQSDEDAYMKSIEPTAPTYPVSGAAGVTGGKGQEEIARQPQPQGRRRFFNGNGIGQGLRNRFN